MLSDYRKLCLNCMSFTLESNICSTCGYQAGAEQRTENALPAGTILNNRFMVGRILGIGGFGLTYLALDLMQNKKVAIKEFMPATMASRRHGRPEIAVDEDYIGEYEYGLNRFDEEAKIIYRYRHHPNIVHVEKLFRENNTAYYVMEYLEGMDLKEMLKVHNMKMDFQELLPIILPVLDALEYIHAENVIHRDVSPDNIYVGNTVKLIDFGASRIALADRSNSLSIILKRGFAPEEQYHSKGKQGPWTDIYATAATMYYCLTGERVPEAPERLGHDRIKDIREFGLHLPESSSTAIMKALSVRAANRYQTVAEFRNALIGRMYPERLKKTKLGAFRLYGLKGLYAKSSLTVGRELIIGRDASRCQLVYPKEYSRISRVHCSLYYDSKYDIVVLHDLNSTWGTWVNGRYLKAGEKVAMNTGDRFGFCNEMFEVVF